MQRSSTCQPSADARPFRIVSFHRRAARSRSLRRSESEFFPRHPGQDRSGSRSCIPVQVQDRASTAPSRAGFRNLLPCQPVASGPVSASPSPTTHAAPPGPGCRRRPRKRGLRAVPKLATFVDATRASSACDVAEGIPPGKLNWLEQLLQATSASWEMVRVNLGVGTFEIGVRDHPRPAVAGACDIQGVHVVLPDDAVQVGVDEVQPGGRAPVAEQPRL